MGGGGGLPHFDLRVPRGGDPLWASFHEEHSDCSGATAESIAREVVAPFTAGVRSSSMYVVAASAHAAAARAAAAELRAPRLLQQRLRCSTALFRLLSKPHSAQLSEVVAALSRSRQWRQLCAALRCEGQHAAAVAVLSGMLRQHCDEVHAAKGAQAELLARLKRVPHDASVGGGLMARAAERAKQERAAALAAARRRRMRLLRAQLGYLRGLCSPHEALVFSSVAPLLGGQLKLAGVQGALSLLRRPRGGYNGWLQAGPRGTPPHGAGSLNPFAVAAFLLTGRAGASLLPAAGTLGFLGEEGGGAPPAWAVAAPGAGTQLEEGATVPTWDGQLAAMAFLEHLVQCNSAPGGVHMALAQLYLQCTEPLLLRVRPQQWLQHMRGAQRQLHAVLAETAGGAAAGRSAPPAQRSASGDSGASEGPAAAALQCIWAAPNPGEETHALLHRLRVRFLHFLHSSADLDATAALRALEGVLRRVQAAVVAHATAEGDASAASSALHVACLHAVLWDLAPERVALLRRLGRHGAAVEVLACHQRDLQGAVAYADGVAGDALRGAGGGVSLEAVDASGSPAAGGVYDALVGALQLATPLHGLTAQLAAVKGDRRAVELLQGALREWEGTCRSMSLSCLPGRARFLDGVSLLQHQGTHSTVAQLQAVLVALLTASAARSSSHAAQVGALQAHKANCAARCAALHRQLSQAQLRAVEEGALQGAGRSAAQYVASLT